MKTIFKGLLTVAFLIQSFLLAQTEITGNVTDESNSMPLPGVNILVKGTTTGASTDFDGNYTIKVSEGEVLVFSYLGYETKEVTYTGESQINVALVQDAGQLDEVVIVGYGTTTKK